MGAEFFKCHLSIAVDDHMILILRSNNMMNSITGFPNREAPLGQVPCDHWRSRVVETSHHATVG